MSIITERWPQCDVCHESNPDGLRDISVRNLRQDIKLDGWLYKKIKGHYEDICPECAPNFTPDSPTKTIFTNVGSFEVIRKGDDDKPKRRL